MSEFLAMLREAIAGLAAADPQLARFGAARHRYVLGPVARDPARLAELPDDLRAYASELAGSGVGPYHGILTLDRAPVIAGPPGLPWQRALAIAHLGCGYAAIVPLDGAARGEVWIDARALGIVAAIYPSFTAYYLDWIDRLATARWPEAFVPPGQCALASALSGYLAVTEQRLGIAAGSLAGAELTEALSLLGPGAIAIAGDLPLFAKDDPVDPCVSCEKLVDNLVASGLRRDVVRPGAVAIPDRA